MREGRGSSRPGGLHGRDSENGGHELTHPKRRAVKLSLAIPSSLVSEAGHLREKTVALGVIGRAAAIFRVDDIYIYRDEPDETQLIRLVMRYQETPQYLRKYLFERRPELAYAGALPPLRAPHHPLESRSAKLEKGEVREGVVLNEVEGQFLVDVGVERPMRVTGRAPSSGGRATIRVTDLSPEPRGVFIGRGDVDYYWGYGVHAWQRGPGKLASCGEFDLTIGTSRLGVPFPVVWETMRQRWQVSRSVLLVFGSPRRGLKDILVDEGLTAEGAFHFLVNAIPEQGCETVRTEEAVWAALAILNIFG